MELRATIFIDDLLASRPSELQRLIDQINDRIINIPQVNGLQKNATILTKEINDKEERT